MGDQAFVPPRPEQGKELSPGIQSPSLELCKGQRLGVCMCGSHSCPTSPEHFQCPGVSEVSRPMWDNRPRLSSRCLWVRTTVIFVAENVESHEFLLPFTQLLPPLPHNECIYCENGCSSLGMPSLSPRWVEQACDSGEPGISSSPDVGNKYLLSPML